MDFDLSDDDRSLADGMRRLCTGRFPLEQLRRSEGRRSLDRAGWSVLAEAGVFSLRLAPSAGGAGLGTAQASVVFEELGRALVPGPVAATHVAAAMVEGAATGERTVGLLPRPGWGGPGGGPSLPAMVGDLGSLDCLLVVDGDAVELVETGELDGEPVEGLDPLTPMWFVAEIPRGAAVGAAAAAEAIWRDHLVLSGALLVGMAASTSDMAVEYAKVRQQFDRPIGAFQAVKHMCADMLVRTELCRAAVHAAAVAVDQPEVGDSVRAAAGAAMLAAQAADANARACIQVYGGMGFTWEVPAHLYLTRARVISQFLGSSGALADVVAGRF